MAIIMKGRFCLNAEISEMAKASSIVRISRSAVTMSTMESGVTMCERATAIAITTTMSFMLDSGRRINALARANFLAKSRTDIKVPGRMICAMEKGH